MKRSGEWTRCVDRDPVGWRNSGSREAKESAVSVVAAAEEDDAPLGRPLLAFLALPSGPASPFAAKPPAAAASALLPSHPRTRARALYIMYGARAR